MKRLAFFITLALATVAGLVIAINVLFYAATRPYVYSDAMNLPRAQAAIVPGAAVSPKGTISSVFKDRLNLAIVLYKAGDVKKILVSGDNSTVSHNEVNPASRYLISQGIPEQDIFLDHAGFDTYSTMYRAQAIFGVTSALIASQSFHLPRAVFIARGLGIKAYGVNADVGHILLHNYVREVFADEKALLDLALHRTPKYLGDRIPITGDGRNYQ